MANPQTIIAYAPQPLTLDPVSGPALPAVEVKPGSQSILGRSSQCQVVLPDEGVSRRHASLSQAAGAWIITDLGSRHGTHVNAVRLSPDTPAPLKHGDLIGLGPWTLRVRIGDQHSSTHVTTIAPGASSATAKDRVERVHERELAAITRNRLNLLIDIAAAVGSADDEGVLARTIAKAAVEGTGFPRAAVLHEMGSQSEYRVVCNVGPEGSTGEAGSLDTQDLLALKAAGAPVPPAPSFSRSLLQLAKQGEVARLTADQPLSGSESIMRLQIQTALCAPVAIGNTIGAYLYLDSRTGEHGPQSASAFAARPVATVQNDAAAFLSALSKMYGLALSNIARKDLEARQKELERDLDAAREAQRMIMPPEEATLGRLTYAMRSKSGRYVAGDLFDVVPLDDGRIAVFLGDVAGKGISAAILMATAQAHLNLALLTNPDPAAAVRSVNRYVCEHAAESRFISLWLGVFDPAKRSLTFVDAGHGHWLFRPASAAARRVVADDAGGIPLGIDDSFVYSSASISLSEGDRVIVYSDGVVEQPGPDAELFGNDRAIAALENSPTPAADVEALFSAVLNYATTDALADDTTVASISI